MGGYSKEMPLIQGPQATAILGGLFLHANAAQGRSLAENHDYCFAEKTAMQLPGETATKSGHVCSMQRDESVYWSIGMSMGWDFGRAFGAATALPENRGAALRPEVCRAEEV